MTLSTYHGIKLSNKVITRYEITSMNYNYWSTSSTSTFHISHFSISHSQLVTKNSSTVLLSEN